MDLRKLLGIISGRNATLALVVLVLAALVGIAVIPQRSVLTVDEMAAWRTAHPLLQQIVADWGLDRIATAPWFLLLLLFLLLALLVSLTNQIAIAWHRTRHFWAGSQHFVGRQPAVSRSDHDIFCSGDAIAGPALAQDSRGLLTVLSCWGSPFFHLGLALVLISSLLLVSTEQRALFRLHEDETQKVDEAPAYEAHGLFARPLALPGTVRLDQVRPEYWQDGGLRQLTSYLTIMNGADSRHCRLAINQPIVEQGVRFQQLENYGKAFFLFMSAEASSESVALLIKQPREVGQAAYGTFNFPSIPYDIKAKYQPWAADVNALPNNLLTLRLENDKGVEGQLILALGKTGRLGPYTVTLEHVSNWAEFVASRTPGMSGIFVGFFLIMLGSALIYLCPGAGKGLRQSG